MLMARDLSRGNQNHGGPAKPSMDLPQTADAVDHSSACHDSSAQGVSDCESQLPQPFLCADHGQPSGAVQSSVTITASGGRYQGTCYDQESRSDASEGARSASDPFRQSEEGPHIWPSLSGPGIRQVVSGTIGQIGSPRTSGISDLHSSPDGSPGGISRPDASHIKQECQQISADAPRNQEGTIGQRGGVQVRATGEARSAHDDRGTQSPTCQSGTGHPADRGAHPASLSDRDLTGWETFPIPPDTHQFLAEAQLASDTNLADPCVECANHTTSNWVAQEMWTWLDQNRVNLAQAPKHHTHSQPRILEVYCSSKSQITRQCRLAGLQAYRFGQDEGDLSTFEGRQALYATIQKRDPDHIWVAPKCTAWGKWAVFNMNKNPTCAQKVIEARHADQVHLLLCDALWQYQVWRDPRCHFHLEQPRGSHMLFQPELEHLRDQLHCAVIDMCTAGQLCHPDSGLPLRKQTEIWTTSAVLFGQLSQYRCTRDHPHDWVAGSFHTPQGTQAVSRFSELYTALFAQRVRRCFIQSAQQEERQSQPQVTLTITESDQPPVKRPRLHGKQPPPATLIQMVQKHLDQALQQAPRVGKLVIQDGPLFDSVQATFPEVEMQCLDICRGIDRKRRPPISLQPGHAPVRRAFGIHRTLGSAFLEDQLEEWEHLSQRQLIRSGEPSRILVTMFAKLREPSQSCGSIPGVTEPSSTPADPKRKTESEDVGSAQKRAHIAPATSETISDTRAFSREGTRATHGPRFRDLPAESRQMIARIHSNLGHPGPDKLKRLLSQQGQDPSIIAAVNDFCCPVCHEDQKPKIARPSSIHEDRDFNDRISADGAFWTSRSGRRYVFPDGAAFRCSGHCSRHRGLSCRLVPMGGSVQGIVGRQCIRVLLRSVCTVGPRPCNAGSCHCSHSSFAARPG